MLGFCHGGNILASYDDGEYDEYNVLMMMSMTRKIMMLVMMRMLRGCLQREATNKMKVTAALFARSPITRIKRQDHTYKVQMMLILVVIIVMLLLI